MNYMARFQIVQDKHIPSESGGVVAEGVRFSDGWLAVNWLRNGNGVLIQYSDMIALHHDFDPVSMALHWVDPPPPGTPTINDSVAQ